MGKKNPMISECFNPDCRKKLDYLRSGQVVRVVHQNGAKAEIEHFWLCGDCCRFSDLRFLANGSLTLSRFPPKKTVEPEYEHRWVRSA